MVFLLVQELCRILIPSVPCEMLICVCVVQAVETSSQLQVLQLEWEQRCAAERGTEVDM